VEGKGRSFGNNTLVPMFGSSKKEELQNSRFLQKQGYRQEGVPR